MSAVNTLGQRFVIDTHLIDDESKAMCDLWSLHERHMIELLRTDVMDTELLQIEDPEKRTRLMGLSAALVEQLGVLILDHSRLDHAVLGSDEDSAMWDAVWKVLSPGRDLATANRKHVRDAMHVWTAMRYGADAFVTLDGSGRGKGLLDRSDAMLGAFDFQLMTPAKAHDFSTRLLRRYEARIPTEGAHPQAQVCRIVRDATATAAAHIPTHRRH